MRSFAVVAGFAAVALAAPQYEAAYPAESSAPAEYPAYPVESSSAPAYEAASSAAEYPSYPAESSSAVYEASMPAYSPAPAYTTTEVVHATSYVCPEPTVITYGPSTYTISTSTTLDIPEYTATYVHTPESEAPYKPSMTEAPYVPEASETHPAYSAVPPVPYPSANGTLPSGPAAGTGYPTGTGALPTATKPATPEFTGAASKATVGFFAIAGALAAFL